MQRASSSSLTPARLLRRYGTVLAAAVIVLVFSLLSPTAFFSLDNALNTLRIVRSMNRPWLNDGVTRSRIR